jgi:hypothetical protein
LSSFLSFFSSVPVRLRGVCSVCWDGCWLFFDLRRDGRRGFVDCEGWGGDRLEFIGEEVVVFSGLCEFVHFLSRASPDIETETRRSGPGRELGTTARSSSRNRPRMLGREGGLPGEESWWLCLSRRMLFSWWDGGSDGLRDSILGYCAGGVVWQKGSPP